MFDSHEKEKTIKLLGVSRWNGPMIAQVFFFLNILKHKIPIELHFKLN